MSKQFVPVLPQMILRAKTIAHFEALVATAASSIDLRVRKDGQEYTVRGRLARAPIREPSKPSTSKRLAPEV